MRPSRHLSFCLFAVALTLLTLVGRAQSGDSVSVAYKSRYTQLYRSYVEQPDHIPTLIGLSDFYADSLNPMFNRPLAYYYINQAELYFTDLLQSGKKIREANRLIKQGVNINAIREKRNRIVLSTMAYLLTDPPLTRSEIDHYGQYFKREPSIRQQLNQMKVSAAYRDAEASQGADGYYAFLDRYGGTDEGDSAEAALVRQAERQLRQAESEEQVDAIAQRYAKNAAVQRAAEKRKGRIAYLHAYNSHTAEAYRDFLLHHPLADDYLNALNMMDTIALEQFYLLQSAQDYVDFIQSHDTDPLAEQALQQLRERIERNHDAGAAARYLEHYPLDADHTRLYQLYYGWHACEGNRGPVADFAERHRDYPFMESVRGDLAQGVRVDAFDLLRPYNAGRESEYASFVRMNMGKRIIFVALQRMLQANLDAKRWKAAQKTMQDLSLCFETECRQEYQELAKLLESADNVPVTRESGSPRLGDGAPIVFADGDKGWEPFCRYDNGTKMLVGRDGDIWTAHYDGTAWQLDTALPAPVNTSYIETDAYMLPDGSGMLFASDRPEGCNIQRSGAYYHGDTALATDLYYVPCANGWWGTPVHLDSPVNTSYCERYPLMSRNGKTLYFVSDGRGGMGYGDIYRATRLDGSWQRWSEPENLGREVNSAHREGKLAFGDDESLLYFASDRGKTKAYYSTATTHNRKAAVGNSGWTLDNVAFHSGDDGEYITHPGALPALADYLKRHPEARVDIVSYHQGVESERCYRISLLRGESVRRYLMSQGVDRHRITVSAYGNSTHISGTELSVRLIER